MKPSLIFLCITSIAFQLVLGQTTDLNPNHYFENEQLDDSVRFEAGIDLLRTQFRTNLDSARSTGFKLVEFAESIDNLNYLATAYRLIGNTYAVQSRF